MRKKYYLCIFDDMKIVRKILLVINLILIVGLLLTTIGGHVAPSVTVLPGLLAYGYLPMLGLNVLMAVIWMLMGRWQCLLSVAAIAARYMLIPLFFQIGGTSKIPSADEHPAMVKVMSYNVRLFRGAQQQPTSTDSNAIDFIGMVRQYNPDVLCLQEYAAPKTVRITDSLVLMGYNHYYGSHTAKTGLPYGTVIFSRMPITYVNRIDGEKLLAEMMLDGRRFRICAIHMDSYRFDAADLDEIERVSHGDMSRGDGHTLDKVKETILCHEEEWNQRIKPVVEASTMPMLLAGDLNDIPNSWLYTQIAKQMKDCFCEKGMGYSNTYNGGFPRFRIDMVFHSEGWQTLSYRRIKTEISDHYPVLTSLELVP